MRRTKLYEELTQELNGVKNGLIENCQEQLNLLEPKYKKLNLNGPLQNDEFLVFARYHYYKDQKERINDPDKYWEKQEKQCREILILLVRYHVSYHNVIGDENAEYLKKYGKCKKSFEEFLMANNEDGKLLEYLAINEHDVEQIVEYTVSYTLKETENIKTKNNQIIVMEYLNKRFDELKEQGHKTDEKADTIIKSLDELQRPGWRQHLIDGGYVYDDGRRTIIKLDLVAYELVCFTRQLTTSKFLQENFLQEDGKKYSSSACHKARDYANKAESTFSRGRF